MTLQTSIGPLNLLFAALHLDGVSKPGRAPSGMRGGGGEARRGHLLLALGTVMINGMKLTPANGAAVVFYPALGKIVS